MIKKLLMSGTAAAVMTGGVALFAFAQTPPPDPGKPVKLHVEIKDNGRVLVRGAKITSIATSTINATLTWEGGASIPWVINTDGSTEYVRRHGGNGSFSEFAVGHTISFSGWLVPASSLTVRADVVRNWSVEKEKINPFGIIQAIDAAAKSFTLLIEERGTIRVLTSADTVILQKNATTTFDALKVGARVAGSGLWDRVANTLSALRIKIHTEDRRVFEGGRLKSVPGAAAPTSMVVTFGKFDYTVNIAEDTSVVNKRWERASLGDFRAGDHIRVYGVAEGITIDATVVRNVDLPRR